MSKDRKLIEASPRLHERLIFGGALIGFWFAVSWIGLVNSLLLPSPMAVVEAALNIGPTLGSHALATTFRAIAGLTIGAAVGIGLGLATRCSRTAKWLIEPLLDAARPVPAIALLPFFILIFGFSEVGRVVLVAVSVAVILAAATVEAIEAMPERWFRFALVAGLTRQQIFLRIIVPGLSPWLRGPMRIALALSFTLVIASEFMGAQQGLGYLINVARVNLATPTILLCVIALGVIAQIFDQVLNFIIMRMSFWYQGTRSALKE